MDRRFEALVISSNGVRCSASYPVLPDVLQLANYALQVMRTWGVADMSEYVLRLVRFVEKKLIEQREDFERVRTEVPGALELSLADTLDDALRIDDQFHTDRSLWGEDRPDDQDDARGRITAAYALWRLEQLVLAHYRGDCVSVLSELSLVAGLLWYAGEAYGRTCSHGDSRLAAADRAHDRYKHWRAVYAYVLERWEEGWPSMSKFANAVAQDVIVHAKGCGVVMAPTNAERQIKDMLRKIRRGEIDGLST